MLKLLRTLPKVLKYLPSDKAKDARNFMMSFQVTHLGKAYASTLARPRCTAAAVVPTICCEEIHVRQINGFLTRGHRF